MYIVKELHFIHDIHNVRWDCIHFLIGVNSLKSVNFLLTIRLLQSCISICHPMKVLLECPTSICVRHCHSIERLPHCSCLLSSAGKSCNMVHSFNVNVYRNIPNKGASAIKSEVPSFPTVVSD